MSRDNALSVSANIATLNMEAQQEANRLTDEKIALDRATLEVSAKTARAQIIYAISSVIAAVAAVIAALASVSNLIFTIINSHSK